MKKSVCRRGVVLGPVFLAAMLAVSCGGSPEPSGYCKGPDFQGGNFQFKLQSCEGSNAAGILLCGAMSQFWGKNDPVEFGPIPLAAWNALPAEVTLTQENIKYLDQPFHATQAQDGDQIRVTSSEELYISTGEIPIIQVKVKITASLQYIELCPTSQTQIEGTAKVTVEKIDPEIYGIAGTVLDNIQFIAELR